MRFNVGRILTTTIQDVKLYGMDYDYTVNIYDDSRTSFVSSFRFVLPRLHDILFNEITIGFYKIDKKRRCCVGIVKLKLKNFLTNDFQRSVSLPISDPSYLNKSDFYDKKFTSVGSVTITFRVDKNNIEKSMPTSTEQSTLLNFIFLEEKAQMYKIAYDIFSATQKGSFFCTINWIFGLVSADYYYTYHYGQCLDETCAGSDGSCENQFCKNTYTDLGFDELKESIQALQYAAASFADSIVTLWVEKARNLDDEKDKHKKAILERLDISESDLIRDFKGDHNSLAYIAFFADDKLVLSFKGTTSITEAMHDLNCDYAEFQNGYAHRGIASLSDRWIGKYWESLKDEIKSRNIKKILLTGQSLGAAASIIIYLRMKEMGLETELDIQVICFGPPPVVSESIAKRRLPKIKIFCYGSDLITRLNFGSVLDLKYICISISSLYDYFVDKNYILEKIADIKKYLSDSPLYTKLYHPGELIHIREFNTDDKTEILYKRVTYMFFEEIICSRKAPFDHLIYKTFHAFKNSLEKHQSPGN